METFKKTFAFAALILSVGIFIFLANIVYREEWKKEIIKECAGRTGFSLLQKYEKELERCFNENGLD